MNFSYATPAFRLAAALPAAARLRLFRRGRIVMAALTLALLPTLAFAGTTPPIVVAALALCGLLPLVAAIEATRPAHTERGAILSLAIAGAALAGGVLKGLPVTAAVALIAAVTLESAAVCRRSGVRKALAAGLAGVFAVGIAALHAAPSGNQESAMLAALVMAAGVICVLLGGFASQASRQAAASRGGQAVTDGVESVISDTVIIFSGNGAVLRASGNAQRLLGLPAATLEGRGLIDLTLVADRPSVLTAIVGSRETNAVRKLRFRLRSGTSDALPSYRWAELAIHPARADGSVVATLRDVSAEHHEEELMKRAAEEAEQARNARAAFLGTLNHELRTPLNAIIGFSDILAQPGLVGADQKRVREYADLINSAGRDLMRMVSAMIDITRIESGVYELEMDDVDLNALAARAVEGVRQDAPGALREIAFQPAAEPIKALADARAVRAALRQIIESAVRTGNVDIACGTDAEGPFIRVDVTGPIMPRRTAASPMDSLDGSSNHATLPQGGPELAVAVAEGLVRLQGGSLSVTPGDAGQSVTVRFQPPAAAGDGNVLSIAEARRGRHAPRTTPNPKVRKRA